MRYQRSAICACPQNIPWKYPASIACMTHMVSLITPKGDVLKAKISNIVEFKLKQMIRKTA